MTLSMYDCVLLCKLTTFQDKYYIEVILCLGLKTKNAADPLVSQHNEKCCNVYTVCFTFVPLGSWGVSLNIAREGNKGKLFGCFRSLTMVQLQAGSQ